MSELVIVGAGGHGRELLSSIEAINQVTPTWDVLGFVDDSPAHPERIERIGAKILGSIESIRGRVVSVAIGIGTSAVRRAMVERLALPSTLLPSIVHPGSSVGRDVELAPGVVIFDRCTLTTNVRVGPHTHLNVGCAVQHDSSIGSFVQVSPGVLINGDCQVGDDVFIGTGAILTRGCDVGAGARVGAGAVVLDTVKSGSTVVGVPARPI